jgi:NitT/TauT family transport system ATP-binding protein
MNFQADSSVSTRIAPENGHVVVDDVSIAFSSREQTVVAIENVSLDVAPGEFVCLLGPSGSGKSTLLNAIAGFIEPSAGYISVDEQIVRSPGPDRGMVFQHHSLFPWKTVRENIAFGPRVSRGSRTAARQEADTFLSLIGLSKFANSYPKELSGGMQQRVGIARALANYPSVLLMDEPFGALDSQTRSMMQENLLNIWRDIGTTVIFVTHDVDEAVYLADRVVILSAGPGQIVSDIPIKLKRPREQDTLVSTEFVKLRAQCMELIRSESQKAFENQYI